MSDAPHNGLPDRDAPGGDAARVEELLADRALFGLDEAEAAELEHLLGGKSGDDAFELLAAAVAAAEVAPEPLPPLLRERLADDGVAFDFRPEPASVTSSSGGGLTSGEASGRGADWPVYTMLAVAAGMLISLWLGPFGRVTPSPAEARVALIADAPDMVRIAWAPQEDAALGAVVPGEGAEGEKAPYGDVVWSDARQEGYMRFQGLKPNDPSVEQYQLWVFDAERDDKYPVDGGVFDIGSGDGVVDVDGEAIVPIRAKLPVSKAVLFAITVEKPGGVVVSDRSRLPLLAQR